MTYDPNNGNLLSLSRPPNEACERMTYNYTYDTQVQTYVTGISDAYGYSSTADYDYKFGIVESTTDLNGNEMRYDIDAKGRIENVYGPLEPGIAVIQFDYYPEANPPYATTKHYDPCNPGNDIETVTFIDGLKRVTQVKKDAAIFVDAGQPDMEEMICSGRLFFDAFGRTTESYYPVIADTNTATTDFYATPDDIAPTTTTYDVLDRALTVTIPDFPDNATTTTVYSIEEDLFSTRITDANNVWKQNWTDIRGLTRQVLELNRDEMGIEDNIMTSYTYNAINEMTMATDGDGNNITFMYDWLGRTKEMNHPDGGLTTFAYDLASNLTQKVTANLSAIDEAILYDYEFERLTNITYPQPTTNNVTYTYGDNGAANYAAGRIISQQDATGTQTFGYNELGALILNERSIKVDDCTTINMTTNWVYDTWNRIKSITYPGGEEVNYQYNEGGLLRSMQGNTDYVQQLGYDEFEQRVYLRYGNGTESRYTYEDQRRRLSNMTAETASDITFMNCSYQYDALNNILGMQNSADGQTLGSSTDYEFGYDDLYRLTSANGMHNGDNDSYTLAMSYTKSHSINTKNQMHIRDGIIEQANTYDNNYRYEGSQPHAPTGVGDFTYTYDANGNMMNRTNNITNQNRELMWDEENRLDQIIENGATFNYTYDAGGERIIKNTGPTVSIALNGVQQNTITNPKGKTNSLDNSLNEQDFNNLNSNGSINAQNTQNTQKQPLCLNEYTVYVNPYIVIRNGQVTKHLYIENQRISSKLAGTLDANGTDFTEGGSPPTYYYHPDHVGNTSYVTDNAGQISQHVEYLPFGEVFVENDNSTNQTPYLFNGKELDEESGLYYYGARYYDPMLSNWLSVDPALTEYPSISPYAYVLNSPIIATDPDGRRVFFVGGAGNDPISQGWNYIHRWRSAFANAGISDFVRVNSSHGQGGDIAFTTDYRSSGTNYESNFRKDPGGGMDRVYTGRELPINNRMVNNTAQKYLDNLAANPLAEGEQLNLAGYSYGSVLQAQVALKLANEGTTIDNLVLIGSPVSDNSKLFQQLSVNENIKNIIRIDIEGDALSNPESLMEYIYGGIQNIPDGGPHYDLARPGSDADKAIRDAVNQIIKEGVKN